MILVLEYKVSDNATYWSNDIMYINSDSIEEAYISIHDLVKYSIESHNLTTEEQFQNFYININDNDISIDNFIDYKGKIDIGIITLEQHISNIQNNAKDLKLK